MSYRTYIYYGDEGQDTKEYKSFQVLGNDESYKEWFDEMVKQKIITRKELENQDYCYGLKFLSSDEEDSDPSTEDDLTCEVKDIMGFVKALEKAIIRMEDDRVKDNPESLSFFNFSNKYKKIKEDKHNSIKLTDELFNIVNYSYLMMPYILIKGCEDCLELVPYEDKKDKDRFFNYKIKKGKKIYIAAY